MDWTEPLAIVDFLGRILGYVGGRGEKEVASADGYKVESFDISEEKQQKDVIMR